MSLLQPNLLPEADEELEPFLNLIKMWQRIEPYSADRDLNPALQAKVADASWFLARQRQIGEFLGESSGSPVLATLQSSWDIISRFQSKSSSSVDYISKLTPIESKVENSPVITNLNPQFRIRIQIANQFKRELKRELNSYFLNVISLLESKVDLIINNSDFTDLLDPNDKSFAMSILGETFNRTVIDGYKLLTQTESYYDTIFGPDNTTPWPHSWPVSNHTEIITTFKKVIIKLKNKFQRLYHFDIVNNLSWDSKSIGYKFSVGSPPDISPIVLHADKYNGQNLDWYSFSADSDSTKFLGDASVKTGEQIERGAQNRIMRFIPNNITFHGMPNHRWWQFENGDTDFGNLTLDKTDIGKLLTMHFALVMSNDWFMLPLPAEVGSLITIDSLEVIDVFGDTLNIPRLGSNENLDPSFKKWDLFSIALKKDPTTANRCSSSETYQSLYIPPSIGKKDESDDLELVELNRDPNATLCWGTEVRIPSTIGGSLDGFYYQQLDIQDSLVSLYLSAYPLMKQTIWPLINDLNIELYDFISLKTRSIGANYNIPELNTLPSDTKLIDYLNLAQGYVIDTNPVIQNLDTIDSSADPESTKKTLILALFEYPPEISEQLEDAGILYSDFVTLAREVIIESVLDKHLGYQRVKLLLTDSDEIRLKQNIIDLLNLITILDDIEDRNRYISIVELILEISINMKAFADITSDIQLKFDAIKQNCNQFIIDNNIDRLKEKNNSYASYKFKSPLPENRIPYLALHDTNNDRNVNWQRVKLKRDHPQLPAINISHRTDILDESPLIYEETISRAGLYIKSTLQRTRWFDGSTYVWLGRNIGVGKGEKQSGLKFDYPNEEKRT